jgi:pyruvate carboxylase
VRGHCPNLRRLLIANRGEIAIRIARSAAELGMPASASPRDDAASLHVKAADAARRCPAPGPAAYLDAAGDRRRRAGRRLRRDPPRLRLPQRERRLRPRLRRRGARFVGPAPARSMLFGDKAQAAPRSQPLRRAGAARAPPRRPPWRKAQAFSPARPGGGMMLKAVAGGGGRGMRPVTAGRAGAGLGALPLRGARRLRRLPTLYVEQLCRARATSRCRSLGDGSGAVVHLWERECSLQRQRQKLIEIAPAPHLDPALRPAVAAPPRCDGRAVRYQSLGTFEFLVDADGGRQRRRPSPSSRPTPGCRSSTR